MILVVWQGTEFEQTKHVQEQGTLLHVENSSVRQGKIYA